MSKRRILVVATLILAIGVVVQIGSRGDRAEEPLPHPESTERAPAARLGLTEPSRARVVTGNSGETPKFPTAASSVASPAQTTPRVFDLGSMVHPTRAAQRSRQFETNESFTADDLAHPERYFERAEHVPELNRPEERRDVLEFFRAYREKLQRDLSDATSQAERDHLIVLIGRYDEAIERLAALSAAP